MLVCQNATYCSIIPRKDDSLWSYRAPIFWTLHGQCGLLPTLPGTVQQCRCFSCYSPAWERLNSSRKCFQRPCVQSLLVSLLVICILGTLQFNFFKHLFADVGILKWRDCWSPFNIVMLATVGLLLFLLSVPNSSWILWQFVWYNWMHYQLKGKHYKCHLFVLQSIVYIFIPGV